MDRLLISIFCLLFLTTCTHRWVAVPQGVPDFEKCKHLKDGPQMLRVPGWKKSYIIVRDCLTMDPQRVSIGMTIFMEEWRKRFPYNGINNRKVENALHELVSEFNDDKKTANAYTVTGMYGNSLTVSGLALSPGWIWVKTMHGERLCNTSFVHELVHIGIWAVKGSDGDPDHLGNKYSGWTDHHMLVMQETESRLCELGI